ncbi:MAG: DUF4271 domain-containing protein [Flavobacteriaceae bacterium]|nr:DUF4271 domain-containing protein [Flavobacteriaceae bacterium]
MGIVTTRELENQDWLTYIILIIFLIIFFLKITNYDLFKITMNSLISSNKNVDITKKNTFSLYNILAFISRTLIASIFILELTKDLDIFKHIDHKTHFFNIFLAFTTYRLTKTTIDSLIINSLENQKYKDLIWRKISNLNAISFLVFPIIIINIYVMKNTFIVIIFATIFISILLIVKLLNTLSSNKNIKIGVLFYFILYLCTLEIAPLLIIYKTIR